MTQIVDHEHYYHVVKHSLANQKDYYCCTIVTTSHIFSMLLSILIFKRECLTPSVVLAVFMVLPSVIFIALNR